MASRKPKPAEGWAIHDQAGTVLPKTFAPTCEEAWKAVTRGDDRAKWVRSGFCAIRVRIVPAAAKEAKRD